MRNIINRLSKYLRYRGSLLVTTVSVNCGEIRLRTRDLKGSTITRNGGMTHFDSKLALITVVGGGVSVYHSKLSHHITAKGSGF